MKFICLLFLFLLVNIQAFSQSNLKHLAHQHIDQLRPLLGSMKDSIAVWAEPSFKEYKTVGLLKETLSAAGFQIEEKLGGVETMFSASFGNNGPTIAILGEYDADVFEDGLRGHASGHHWLGVGSVGAALSLQRLIAKGEIVARIVYIGSTAEGGFGGRAHLARKGYFQGIDLAIFWHPSPVTWASTRPWDALIDLEIEFVAEKTKAIEESTKSSSLFLQVLDFASTLEDIKEKLNATTHLHYSLESPPASYNYTMDAIGLKIRIQTVQQAQANQLYRAIEQKVQEIQGEGGAVQLSIFRAIHAFLPNNPGMQMVAKNMEALGSIPITPVEQAQAKTIQGELGLPTSGLRVNRLPFQAFSGAKQLRKYASDIGDVSWWAPTLSFVTTCYPAGVPIGQPVAAELAFDAYGEQGMLYAAKLICSSIIDYLHNETLQEAIRAAFKKAIGTQSYFNLEPGSLPTAEKNSKRTK
ncbi:MAG: hypothetical protein KTR30_21545 [Saprospiraceae bacterium]|nr:hypothetical protein [Saprospiraceae bacterium]